MEDLQVFFSVNNMWCVKLDVSLQCVQLFCVHV